MENSIKFSWKFGERVRFVRRQHNLNQSEYGELLGVSRQTINAYENDRQTPPMEMMQKMCDLHDVNPSWLLTGVGEMEPSVFDWVASHIKPVGDPMILGDISPYQIALSQFIADPVRAEKLAKQLWDKAIGNIIGGPSALEEEMLEGLKHELQVVIKMIERFPSPVEINDDFIDLAGMETRIKDIIAKAKGNN